MDINIHILRVLYFVWIFSLVSRRESPVRNQILSPRNLGNILWTRKSFLLSISLMVNVLVCWNMHYVTSLYTYSANAMLIVLDWYHNLTDEDTSQQRWNNCYVHYAVGSEGRILAHMELASSNLLNFILLPQ